MDNSLTTEVKGSYTNLTKVGVVQGFSGKVWNILLGFLMLLVMETVSAGQLNLQENSLDRGVPGTFGMLCFSQIWEFQIRFQML